MGCSLAAARVGQVEAKKVAALLQKEEAEWKWSPLFRAVFKLIDMPFHYRGRPFQHTLSELQDIICWASEELLPRFKTLPIPAKDRSYLDEYKMEFRTLRQM